MKFSNIGLQIFLQFFCVRNALVYSILHRSLGSPSLIICYVLSNPTMNFWIILHDFSIIWFPQTYALLSFPDIPWPNFQILVFLYSKDFSKNYCMIP